MKTFNALLISIFLVMICTSCHTTETIVSSPYKLKNEKTVLYSTKTFMFKNYFFSYQNGEATLVYQQDSKLKEHTQPIYLTLKENTEKHRYQEFTDTTKKIIVKVISDHEVRLQLDKARYTLYTAEHLNEINADTPRILADIAIWKNDRF